MIYDVRPELAESIRAVGKNSGVAGGERARSDRKRRAECGPLD